MIFSLDHLGAVNVHATAGRWRGPDIAEAVTNRAHELVNMGLGPGDRAVLCQIGSGSFFADLLAVWAAGAAAAVLNPGLTADEIDNIVSHIEPKLALVDSSLKSANEKFAVPVVDFGAGVRPTFLPNSKSRPGSLDDPALLDHFFRLGGVEKAIGTPPARNFPAVFNYKAEGWRLEGVLKGHLKSKSGKGRLDQYQFGLLKDEWLAICEGQQP